MDEEISVYRYTSSMRVPLESSIQGITGSVGRIQRLRVVYETMKVVL